MRSTALSVAVIMLAEVIGASGASNNRIISIADQKVFIAPSVLKLPFELAQVPHGQQVRLSIDVRMDVPGYNGGYGALLTVTVNGVDLLGPDLLNKPLDVFCKNGMDTSWVSGAKWVVIYSPDFSDKVCTDPNPWGFSREDEPYHYIWDITRQVKSGRNELVFNCPKILVQPMTTVVKNVRVEVGEPIPSKNRPTPAPAGDGPLPTYIPRADNAPVAMDVQLSPAGSIRVKVAAQSFDITSRTSEPNGKWVTTGGNLAPSLTKGQTATAQWSGTGYQVTRKVTLYDDRVQVADTFTNTSDKVVGIIYQNRLALPKVNPLNVRLGGWRQYAPTQQDDRPAHPSAIAEMDGLTLGLFAEDDIFRVHVRCFAEPGLIGIGDPRLGIGPGKSHTLEWSIYPVVKGDYWDLINAVRRNWGSNYPIPGPFVIDGQAQTFRSKEAVDRWIKTRGVKWVCTNQTTYLTDQELKKYGGPHRCDQAEGTAIPLAKIWAKNIQDWVKKVHATNPDVKAMTYLHTQICTEPNAETLYADSRLVSADGKPITAVWKDPIYMYVPTLENSYGKALRKVVEERINEIGLDGFFNDQFNCGESVAYGYHLPWDGCSLDIDQNTHDIVRQSSSIALLQLPWKAWMVKYLHDRGKVILGNESLHTRAMLRMKVPAFVETGSYANLIDCHLACPLGLGNHDVDFTTPQSQARMCRRMLDQGGLLATYTLPDEPKAKPFIGYMHPITPMEIRAGMILGRERIITNRSGCYGWPDGSAAKAYEFDGDGQLVKNPTVKEINAAGKRRYELRMPGDHFAVLIREGPWSR